MKLYKTILISSLLVTTVSQADSLIVNENSWPNKTINQTQQLLKIRNSETQVCEKGVVQPNSTQQGLVGLSDIDSTNSLQYAFYAEKDNECGSKPIGYFIRRCTNPIESKTCTTYVMQQPDTAYKLEYINQELTISYLPPYLTYIPTQVTTANKPASLDFTQYILNLPEGAPKATLTLTPKKVAGLSFDEETGLLTGVPNQVGSYQFTAVVKSSLGQSLPKTFRVNVRDNPEDKIVWKDIDTLPEAAVDVPYSYDLNNVIQESKGNVIFAIAEAYPRPDWLKVEGNFLVGTPTPEVAGSNQEVWLYARTPTGGEAQDSQGNEVPLKIDIPVAYDGRLRPVMQSADKKVGAGEGVRFDLRNLVNDPTNDPNLKIVLDKVEPFNEQLKLAISQSTVLEGLAPMDAPGETFKLTLHAYNSKGGDSEPALVNLKVETSSAYKPRFNTDNPVLPFLIPGTPLFHDFEESHDVWPEGIPFTIEFAKGYSHPSWLTIENNQLKAERVPLDIHRDIKFHVIIRNTPGGESQVVALNLYYMD